jgi:HupE / UreJ protein
MAPATTSRNPSRSRRRWRLASFALLGVARLAWTHPAPYSYIDLTIDASGAQGALVVHDFDAAHELGIEDPLQLQEPAVAAERRDQLLGLLQPRLIIRQDAGTLQPTWSGIDVLPERQSLRLPFRLDGVLGPVIDITTRMFPYDPAHQTFVNIYERGALRHQAIIDGQTQVMRYYRHTVQGRWEVVRRFVFAGEDHILEGPDHILFLLGLLLMGGSLWRLLTIVSAFTVGHSVTLSLAALGIVQASTRLIEPAIALSVVVVGADNLLVLLERRHATAQASRRDLRPAMAGVFGLIHGLGFASVLVQLGLPRDALVWSLASFNVGVELGQLAIVLLIGGALWALRGFSTQAWRMVALAGSAAVVLAGTWWFVQRMWFTV